LGGWREGGPTPDPLRDGVGPGRAAFALLHEARAAGLTAQMELGGRSLKNQLAHAARLGARYVAICSPGEVVLRDTQGGGQQTVSRTAVVHAVLRGLHEL